MAAGGGERLEPAVAAGGWEGVEPAVAACGGRVWI